MLFVANLCIRTFFPFLWFFRSLSDLYTNICLVNVLGKWMTNSQNTVPVNIPPWQILNSLGSLVRINHLFSKKTKKSWKPFHYIMFNPCDTKPSIRPLHGRCRDVQYHNKLLFSNDYHKVNLTMDLTKLRESLKCHRNIRRSNWWIYIIKI